MFFLKDLHIVVPIAISLLLLIIILAVVYVNFADIDHLLVIHFDAYRGIDYFGERSDVYDIWFSGLALVAINIFLISVFYKRRRFAAYLLSYGTAIIVVLILLAIDAIISIN
ncbi:MAG: hypothetical protein Q8Q37_01810 [bacterium]|nr:hypothetical protein [bacterium]